MSMREGAGHGEYKVPGGKLVVVDLAVAGGRIDGVQVSGDFFLEPPEALDAVNAAIDGMPADAGADALTQAAAGVLADGAQTYGITPEGIGVAVRRALDAVGEDQGGAA
mgnify:CR=1 FL=1